MIYKKKEQRPEKASDIYFFCYFRVLQPIVIISLYSGELTTCDPPAVSYFDM